MGWSRGVGPSCTLTNRRGRANNRKDEGKKGTRKKISRRKQRKQRERRGEYRRNRGYTCDMEGTTSCCGEIEAWAPIMCYV